MKIKYIYSPNYNKKKRKNYAIKAIIIHYTGMQLERESVKKLSNIKSKLSSHYLIGRSGKILRFVEDKYIAWHAGKSRWGRYKNLNKNSIGIELVNKGHQFGYQSFKKKQILNLIKLCKILIKKYKIKKSNIIGHSDIAPLRKIDPGEKFPWEFLAKNKVGIWHDYESNFLKKFRKVKILKKKDKVKFVKNLFKFGYNCSSKNPKFLFRVIKAFQRHFRKELINGYFDQECYIILKNLTKKS